MIVNKTKFWDGKNWIPTYGVELGSMSKERADRVRNALLQISNFDINTKENEYGEVEVIAVWESKYKMSKNDILSMVLNSLAISI